MVFNKSYLKKGSQTTQMEKPLFLQIAYYKLIFQCYLFVLVRFVRFFFDFYFFFFALQLINQNAHASGLQLY